MTHLRCVKRHPPSLIPLLNLSFSTQTHYLYSHALFFFQLIISHHTPILTFNFFSCFHHPSKLPSQTYNSPLSHFIIFYTLPASFSKPTTATHSLVSSRFLFLGLFCYKGNFQGVLYEGNNVLVDCLVGKQILLGMGGIGKEYDGVVSVFPNEKIQVLTTKSWDFIGFSQHVERANYDSDIIIGVIDTGIWPKSKSFNDNGFGPPPSKWKGTCQTSTSNVTCNNKLIGAKYYKHDGQFSPMDIKSPRDSIGHGTHTSSTVAGNPLGGASMLGLGQGTSRGGVPSARIAVYKVCWSDGCQATDLMHAFDEAIGDGVDILSVSLGGSQPDKFLRDPLSIGSLHAMRKGILTVFAGGNYGPRPSSITNVAPWSITVGAGTIDRKFITKVQLGDNTMYEGIPLNTFDLMGKLYPIMYAGDAPNTKAGFNGHSRLCSTNSLDHKLVNGKIVLCEGNLDSSKLLEASVVGVLTSGLFRDVAHSSPLPACDLGKKDVVNVYQYIRSTRTPTATIFKTNELRDSLAPRVASFSSRGPNLVTQEILKPDLIAPGVDIIASWSSNSCCFYIF